MRWEQAVAIGRAVMAKAMDEVKAPGSKGGRGYRTKSGTWRYGEFAQAHEPLAHEQHYEKRDGHHELARHARSKGRDDLAVYHNLMAAAHDKMGDRKRNVGPGRYGIGSHTERDIHEDLEAAEHHKGRAHEAFLSEVGLGKRHPTPGRGLDGADSDEAQDKIGSDLEARLRAKMKQGNSDAR